MVRQFWCSPFGFTSSDIDSPLEHPLPHSLSPCALISPKEFRSSGLHNPDSCVCSPCHRVFPQSASDDAATERPHIEVEGSIERSPPSERNDLLFTKIGRFLRKFCSKPFSPGFRVWVETCEREKSAATQLFEDLSSQSTPAPLEEFNEPFRDPIQSELEGA